MNSKHVVEKLGNLATVPDRERDAVEQIAKLLADGKCGLSFQRNALGVRRITPLAAHDGDFSALGFLRETVNQLA